MRHTIIKIFVAVLISMSLQALSCMILGNEIMAQSRHQQIVTGKIIDTSNKPLVGVKVFFKGYNRGVISNIKGEYKIEVPRNGKNLILTYKFVGMKTVNKPYNNQKVINIKMVDDIFESNEVVITGVFNKPKESFTGAAVKITNKELKISSNRNLLQSIANIDPSFVLVEKNQYGSDPNRLPEVRIRGFSAIPDVDDLKGEQRASLVTPLFILDGFEISLQQMMDLNKDEIKSITILKDASATAMYGSRGANGVVVITSIQPQKGKLKFNYSGNFNLEIPDLSSYHLLNATQKLKIERIAGLYESNDPKNDLILKDLYRHKKERVLAGVNTDWLGYPVQVGLGQNHYFSLSGGDNRFRYSMGLSYNRIVGAIKGSDRNTFNGNLRLMYLTEKFSFIDAVSIGMTTASNGNYGSFDDYASKNPYYEPYDKDGLPVTYFETQPNPVFGKRVNPLYNATIGNFNKQRFDNIMNNFSLTYKPTSSIYATVNFSFGKGFSQMDDFTSPRDIQYSDEINPLKKGQRSFYSQESINWSLSSTLNYFNVWGKHTLTAGLNYTMYSNTSNSRGMTVIGFVNENMNGIYSGNKYKDDRPRGSYANSHTMGISGSFNYVYDNRYFIDGSYRLDGSSSFGNLSRWAPFWSVGTGWNVTNEKFMKPYLNTLSHMRIRYSYGASGSKNFSPWEAIGTYTIDPGRVYLGGLTARMTALENPQLRWQTTFQQNIGLDLSFFQGLVSFSGNAYHKLTKDAISKIALPLSNGFDKYKGNYGDILNKGYDLDLSVYLYKNPMKGIAWNVRVGTSHNENKLLKISQFMKDKLKERSSNIYEQFNLYYVYQEGQSIDAIYAIRTYGVDPSTGKIVYRYKNGDQSYKYDISQRVPIGDRLPKVNMRLSTSLNWKRLSLYAGFTLRLGGYKYNSTYATKVENVNLANNVDVRVFNNRWKKPGDNAVFYGLNERELYITDRYVQKENALICHNINLTYDLTYPFLRKRSIQGLYFNASLGNVFYISTIKEERGTSYPYAIQPSFGITCSF